MESGNLQAFYTSCEMPDIRTRKAMYTHRSTNSIGIATILEWGEAPYMDFVVVVVVIQLSGFHYPYLKHSWITTGV